MACLTAVALTIAVVLTVNQVWGQEQESSRIVKIHFKGEEKNLPKSLTSEQRERAIQLAMENDEFKKLVDEGWEIVRITPIVRGKVDFKGDKFEIRDIRVIGAMIGLEKNSKMTYATVYFESGKVIVSNSIRIENP